MCNIHESNNRSFMFTFYSSSMHQSYTRDWPDPMSHHGSALTAIISARKTLSSHGFEPLISPVRNRLVSHAHYVWNLKNHIRLSKLSQVYLFTVKI